MCIRDRSYLGRPSEALEAADALAGCLGPVPPPAAAWFLHLYYGTAWANDEPSRAVAHFERASDHALLGGLPFLAHITDRDAFAAYITQLEPLQAARVAHDVLAAMWDDRDVLGIRIALAHIVVVCVAMSRCRDAAMIDGWLAADPIALIPQYQERLGNARRQIDAQLGVNSVELRSQGAASNIGAIVQGALATLASIE